MDSCSKIRILLQYFRKDELIYAHDPEKKCKTGDMVLIKELPKKMTRLITHEVLEIIHPLGDITDPITNKKVVVGQYRDMVDNVNEMFGKSPNGFDYGNAPERGWQEDKKDYTHRETYIKYHEFENDDQPYAV